MKNLRTAVLAAAAVFAAARLSAAPRCSNGQTPRLSGDAFSPVECSTVTLRVVLLPGLPVVREGKDIKTDLRELEGRWEGTLIQGMGRYALLLSVKTAWSGKTELVLATKEQQFRDKMTDTLTLVPSKERGSYAAALKTTLAPDASLSGAAVLGVAVAPSVSSGTAPAPDRQAELTFANGALHRFYFAVKGDELRVRAFSAVPGAPLQKFETTLRRTKRDAL